MKTKIRRRRCVWPFLLTAGTCLVPVACTGAGGAGADDHLRKPDGGFAPPDGNGFSPDGTEEEGSQVDVSAETDSDPEVHTVDVSAEADSDPEVRPDGGADISDATYIDREDEGQTRDAEGGSEIDARCACTSVGTVPNRERYSVSLDCFCDGIRPCEKYQNILRDPCTVLRWFDPDTQVYFTTFEDCNLVAVGRHVIDGPDETWFYDPATNALVGAKRVYQYARPFVDLCIHESDASVFSFAVEGGAIPTNCTKGRTEQVCPPPDGGRDAASD